jgi:hypothetical protein
MSITARSRREREQVQKYHLVSASDYITCAVAVKASHIQPCALRARIQSGAGVHGRYWRSATDRTNSFEPRDDFVLTFQMLFFFGDVLLREHELRL